MATKIVEAVFADGSFRPVEPSDLALTEGQKVRLIIETIGSPDDILELAARVYDGLTSEQIDAVEQLQQRRDDFFEGRASA